MPPFRPSTSLSLLSNLSTQAPTKSSLLLRRSSPFICPSCLSHRSLTTTPPLLKKSSASKKSNRKDPLPTTTTSDNVVTATNTPGTGEIDPYDYSELQAGINKAIARLKEALVKTKDAGRVSTGMVEGIDVELVTKDSNHNVTKETHKLGSLASVAPKGGRVLQVFAAEEAHVKPLIAGIQASGHSLTPTVPSATNNPLLIEIPVPPVTNETREQAKQEAKKCLEKCLGEIRNARGDAQKRHRKMETQKLVVVDELRKAHKGMEEVVKKGEGEARGVSEGVVKGLER